jgi:mycothiol synthase
VSALEQLTFRPPRSEEAAAVADLSNADSRRVWGSDDTDTDDIATAWTSPGLDLERDAIVAFDPEGRLVGYASFRDVASNHRQFWLWVRVDPPDQMLEATLMRRLEARAKELAVPGAVLRTSVSEPASDRRRTVTDELGYRLIRHAFRMEIEWENEPPEPIWPDGISVRTYVVGDDDEAAYKADMEGFADHFGFEQEPFDGWLHWMLREPFDPTLNFLAVEGDEVVAFCMCPPHKEGEPGLGWVDNLAVRPPWRRRGIALALLRHAVREFHARGFRRAGLGVDGENTTGAVRLYERAGMRVVRRWDQFEKAVDA